MASQSAQRDALRVCEWDVADVHWAHGSTREMQRVQCVFRRVPHGAARSEWEPWVVVAESCIMRRVGKSGLGLYAALRGARSFHRDNLVGAYEGAVVGTYPSRQAALASVQCARLVRKGHDKLITRRPRDGGPGVELVDGDQGGGPPFLHRINDPRGTRLQPNVALTPGGYIQVTQARVPAFDLAKDHEGNAASELRFSYGDEYWDVMERLGASVEYALEVD
jgi:hypothetical protein